MFISRTVYQRLTGIPMLMSFYLPYFISSVSTGMLVPVLPLYAADFGVQYGVIGLVLAAEGIGTLLGDVPAGVLLRRYGTKRVMLLGLAGILAAAAALYFSTTIAGVIVCRLLSGFCRALYGVSQHMILSSRVPVAWRGRAIATFGGVFRAGGFIGPALGGGLGLLLGLRAIFLIIAAVLGISMLMMLLFLENDYQKLKPDEKAEAHRGQLFQVIQNHRRILAIAGIGQLFAQMIRAGRQAIVPLYAADVVGLDVGAIGAIISLGTAMDVLMVYPAGIIMDRFGRKRAIVPCFAIQAAGMLLVPLTQDALGLLLVTMLMGFGNGLGSGTMMTLGSDLAPPLARGEFLGVWRLVGDIGFSGGPVLVGGVADVLMLPAAALTVALAGFIATLTFALFVPETLELRRKKQP